MNIQIQPGLVFSTQPFTKRGVIGKGFTHGRTFWRNSCCSWSAYNTKWSFRAFEKMKCLILQAFSFLKVLVLVFKFFPSWYAMVSYWYLVGIKGNKKFKLIKKNLSIFMSCSMCRIKPNGMGFTKIRAHKRQ